MPSALSSPLTGRWSTAWIAALKQAANRLSFPVPNENLALVGASGALLAITVVSFLDYYPWLLNPGRVWQWFLWGLWGGLYARTVWRVKHG